jgi:hypothetical protein
MAEDSAIRKVILETLVDFRDVDGDPLRIGIGEAGRLTDAIIRGLRESGYLPGEPSAQNSK